MKRDIKFRALKDDMSDCRFVYGQLTYGIDPITVTFYPRIHEVIGQPFSTSCLPNTEGQFTGLCDKNGVEIYEGDILRITEPKYEVIFGIEWNVDFCCYDYYVMTKSEKRGSKLLYSIQESLDRTGKEFCNVIEVIGNIYQNKELLK